MKSLDTGTSPIRAVRIPDELWSRFERWAAVHGKDDADAIRELIENAAENAPSSGVVVRPPLKWMTHPRTGAPGQVFGRVHGEDNWWDLDDLLAVSSGCKFVLNRGRTVWRVLPEENLPLVLSAFRGKEHRLRLHHTSSEGPRLASAPVLDDELTESGAV